MYFGIKRKNQKPEKIFSNEAIFFLGVLATGVSIGFFGEAVDTGSGHFSMLLLIAAVIYGILGLCFPSKLVWVFSLLSLGSWMGTETGYISGWGAYYHGIKTDDGMTRGFGITFLFINLYARFFEFLWNGLHKAVIFILLAASFWYIGSRAEKIWNLGFINPKETSE